MKIYEFSRSAERLFPMLLSHALKFTRDADDAKDLVQETLLKGFRFCDKFDPKTNIKGWLYVIMRNTYINQYRKNKAKQLAITTEEEITDAQLKNTASSNTALSDFAISDIHKALNAINPIFRQPFQRYVEGYKYDEISLELDIPLGTVKTRIHMAREALKRYLKIYKPGI